MKILGNNSNTIVKDNNDNNDINKNTMNIEKLCHLSYIDISLNNKVKKSDILRDINIILNCAKALNDNDDNNINEDNDRKIMTLTTLREDKPIIQDKELVLLNSKIKHKNFFVVPKRDKREIEE